jgi:hypothetical protein
VGITLMLIGLLTHVAILWMGFVAVVIGAVLTVASRAGYPVAGIVHWY